MSSRYDEHDDDDYDDLRSSRRRRTGNECSHCGCPDEPVVREQISAAGWVTFIMLLLFCWPLFWIGLMMKEPYLVCGECGRRVN